MDGLEFLILKMVEWEGKGPASGRERLPAILRINGIVARHRMEHGFRRGIVMNRAMECGLGLKEDLFNKMGSTSVCLDQSDLTRENIKLFETVGPGSANPLTYVKLILYLLPMAPVNK